LRKGLTEKAGKIGGIGRRFRDAQKSRLTGALDSKVAHRSPIFEFFSSLLDAARLKYPSPARSHGAGSEGGIVRQLVVLMAEPLPIQVT
jgi:hypothetical protein